MSSLQFDSAEPAGAATLSCTTCSQTIGNVYHQANGQVICSSCRTKIESGLAAGGNLPRAAAFGLGAAVAGAVLYFGFTAITDIEWALVAIAVGWMVGKGVSMGSGGKGGPVFQVMAVALTYLSIAGAYALLVNHLSSGLAAAMVGWPELIIQAAQFPFQEIDVINLVIIGVGLFQAWQLNAPAQPVTVTGPYSLMPKPEAGVALAGE